MADDGTKITLRVGPEEIQMMEDYMADHKIGNRSDFIRDAIRGYIEYKNLEANAPSKAEVDGIFVRFSDLQLETLANLARLGICLSEEEFVRKCVLDVIVPKDAGIKAIDEAFASAQMSAALK